MLRTSSYTFLQDICVFPDDAICNISIYADNNTLWSKIEQVFDLWK